MNQSQCSYCGIDVFDQSAVCQNCAEMFGHPPALIETKTQTFASVVEEIGAANTEAAVADTTPAVVADFTSIGAIQNTPAPSGFDAFQNYSPASPYQDAQAAKDEWSPDEYQPAQESAEPIFHSEPEAAPSESAAEPEIDFQPEQPAPVFALPRQPVASRWSRCEVCRAVIPINDYVCGACAMNAAPPPAKKSSFGKFAFVFLLLALAVGGTSYYYFFEESSALGILRKYERVTGASKALVFDTYSIKGEAKFTVTTSNIGGLNVQKGKLVSSGPSTLMDEKFYFEMFFKNPNKMLVDYYRMSITPGAAGGRDSLIKQGFNGTKGWKYEKRPNQAAQVSEIGENDFPGRKMGLGIDEYESVEIFTDAMRAEFFGDPTKYFESVKTIDVDGVQKPVEAKNILRLKKKKAAADSNYQLLVFDKDSGFLVGLVERTKNNGADVNVYVTVDKYRKFFVKEKTLFGVRNRSVLVPTSWHFNMKPRNAANPDVNVNIALTLDSLDTDMPVDEQIFEMPKN